MGGEEGNPGKQGKKKGGPHIRSNHIKTFRSEERLQYALPKGRKRKKKRDLESGRGSRKIHSINKIRRYEKGVPAIL